MTSRALLLMALVVGGCTNVPAAEDLEVQEQHQPWTPAFASIPDARPAPETPPPTVADDAEVVRRAGQPWIEVGRYHGNADEDWSDDVDKESSARCPFGVRASGFPAVAIEGDQIVGSLSEWSSASDGEDEILRVTWHGVDTDSVEHRMTVYDGNSGWNDGGYHEHCRALWEQAKTNADQINRRLAQRSWRELKKLGIHIYDPGEHNYLEWEHTEIVDTPAAVRPAELMFLAGQAIVRIPGLRVIERTEVDWWNDGDEEHCDRTPHLREAWGDVESGAVAVLLDHESGACFCYSSMKMHVLRWSAETFEAAEREADPRPREDEVPTEAEDESPTEAEDEGPTEADAVTADEPTPSSSAAPH
ncbi:hypothetical protein [Paraliomyxa miuraensis]|uniref:hypothetical protein n=1 Tax=Paraliomyxa miuraensis TaxID=376150 RepID=UPI00225283D3|nr:hypothetical protein [Paraliomyxa miuraensis]MCX4241141.1 hypothetical protein [Paraliomyxa miuraensis]